MTQCTSQCFISQSWLRWVSRWEYTGMEFQYSLKEEKKKIGKKWKLLSLWTVGSSSDLWVSELCIKGFSSCFAHLMSLVCIKVCHWKDGDFGLWEGTCLDERVNTVCKISYSWMRKPLQTLAELVCRIFCHIYGVFWGFIFFLQCFFYM